jgi:hypothetical protein
LQAPDVSAAEIAGQAPSPSTRNHIAQQLRGVPVDTAAKVLRARGLSPFLHTSKPLLLLALGQNRQARLGRDQAHRSGLQRCGVF